MGLIVQLHNFWLMSFLDCHSIEAFNIYMNKIHVFVTKNCFKILGFPVMLNPLLHFLARMVSSTVWSFSNFYVNLWSKYLSKINPLKFHWIELTIFLSNHKPFLKSIPKIFSWIYMKKKEKNSQTVVTILSTI